MRDNFYAFILDNIATPGRRQRKAIRKRVDYYIEASAVEAIIVPGRVSTIIPSFTIRRDDNSYIGGALLIEKLALVC